MIINLSKGRVGETNANLLGSMFVTKIYLGAMSRADLSAVELQKLPDFYLYVDEFQSFANESFADILSESRKYKLNLIIAHQYVEQMPEEVQAAVFGNVGTTIAFRVGPLDAELLEKVFTPTFLIEDLINLGFAQIYLSLMVDGVGSKPFSAQTIPPIKAPDKSFKEEIIANTRAVYAHTRAQVEEEINNWYKPAEVIKTPKPFQSVAKVETKIENKTEFFEKKTFLPPRPPGQKEKPMEIKKEILKEMPRETYRQEAKKETPPLRPLPPKPDSMANRGMPLGYLSQNKKKEPSPENKLVLKEALLKAMAEHKEVPTVSSSKIPTLPSSPPSPPNTEGRKEIPEEVLRKVLE